MQRGCINVVLPRVYATGTTRLGTTGQVAGGQIHKVEYAPRSPTNIAHHCGHISSRSNIESCRSARVITGTVMMIDRELEETRSLGPKRTSRTTRNAMLESHGNNESTQNEWRHCSTKQRVTQAGRSMIYHADAYPAM